MKRITMLMAVVAMLALPVMGQSKGKGGEEVKGVIYANPLGLVIGLANLGYEGALKDNQSWLVEADYASYGLVSNSYTIFGGGVGYRWHFPEASQKNLEGWYVGPRLNVLSLTWSYDTYTYDSSFNLIKTKASLGGLFYGGMADGGYQWIFNSGFMINVGASLGFNAGGVSSSVAGGPALGFGGAAYGGNFCIGYAFR